MCNLISALKKEEEKSAGAERIVEHSPKILALEDKAATITSPPPPPLSQVVETANAETQVLPAENPEKSKVPSVKPGGGQSMAFVCLVY